MKYSITSNGTDGKPYDDGDYDTYEDAVQGFNTAIEEAKDPWAGAPTEITDVYLIENETGDALLGWSNPKLS